MSSEDHKSKTDVKFDSFNIGRKEKIDYFSKNQPKPRKKISEWKIFKGKNKFITIGIFVAILAGIAFLIYYFGFYVPNNEWELTPEEQAFVEFKYGTIDEAQNIAGDTEAGLAAAMAYINDRAAQDSDVNDEFITRTAMVYVYVKRAMYQEAINYLSTLNIEGLNENNLMSYYTMFSFLYRQLGNMEAAREYDIKTYLPYGGTPEEIRETEEMLDAENSLVEAKEDE